MSDTNATGEAPDRSDLEIRAELREVAAKLIELGLRRDVLIRAALKAHVRPVDVSADSGLSRSRIYQITDSP